MAPPRSRSTSVSTGQRPISPCTQRHVPTAARPQQRQPHTPPRTGMGQALAGPDCRRLRRARRRRRRLPKRSPHQTLRRLHRSAPQPRPDTHRGYRRRCCQPCHQAPTGHRRHQAHQRNRRLHLVRAGCRRPRRAHGTHPGRVQNRASHQRAQHPGWIPFSTTSQRNSRPRMRKPDQRKRAIAANATVALRSDRSMELRIPESQSVTACHPMRSA
jgi:hypothetical protein